MTTMTNNQPLPSCKEMFIAKVARVRPHVKPFIFMATMVILLYAASVLIQPGWLTWVFSAAPMFLIGIAVVARLDDIELDQVGRRWNVRRFGLMLAGASAIGIVIGRPLRMWMDGEVQLITDFPTWSEVAFRWGIALMLITTPHLPPFWRFVSGIYRTEREAKKAAAAATIRGLYPTGEHPVHLSTEMSDIVAGIEQAVAATPSPVRLYEPKEIERRRGGDRREEGP